MYGLNALYGRNGAGKTRLLNAMSEIVSGERAGARVIVRPLDEARIAAQIIDAHDRWLGDAERYDLEQRFGRFPWRHESRSALDSALGDVVFERWLRMGSWPHWGRDDDGRPPAVEVVDELVRNATWVLHSKGSGRWNLQVAVRFTESTPLLAGLRQRVVDEWEAAEQDLPADMWDVADEDRSDESFERESQVVMQFSQRLSRRDFFTVLGPLPYPDAVGDYSDELDELRARDALVYVATVCDGAAKGPLCEMRTDRDLIAFTDLSAETIRAIRTWGRHEHRAALEQQGANEEEIFFQSVLGEGLSMIEPDGSGAQLAAWVQAPVDHLVGSVNALLGAMLPEPPTLNCVIAEPEQWADSEPCRWSATDPTGAEVDLDQLSGAQTRLLRLAFTLTLDGYRRRFRTPGRDDPACRPAMVMIDEPEAGLHRLAEDELTQALHDYGLANGAAVVAATHSSSFLRNPHVALVEVYRRANGWTTARRVEFPDRANADALGINRADLLQLHQLVLLVEGHHDRLVLSEMLGRELGRRRVLQVPLRGTFNLNAIVDLEILAHTLELPVLAVIDNANSDAIDDLWTRLRNLPAEADPKDADAVFEQTLGPNKNRTDEVRQIAALARNLLQRGQLDRFEVYGLSRGDIIEYLPVERLVPDATSWERLREEHVEAQRDSPGAAPKDFKKWLTKAHNADFGDDALLLAAAVAAESPPDELLLLLARIDSTIDSWVR